MRQILNVVNRIGNTESELVQVRFKTLGTILRNGSPVQINKNDLVCLILRSPDLENSIRQASFFTPLRAIAVRTFVVLEMERVFEVFVTSQSPQARELYRSVHFQFLLHYPKERAGSARRWLFSRRIYSVLCYSPRM